MNTQTKIVYEYFKKRRYSKEEVLLLRNKQSKFEVAEWLQKDFQETTYSYYFNPQLTDLDVPKKVGYFSKDFLTDALYSLVSSVNIDFLAIADRLMEQQS